MAGGRRYRGIRDTHGYAGEIDDILILQHVPWEEPGALGDLLTARGLRWRTDNISALSDAEGAPKLGTLGGLVLLGGPMGARDTQEHPGLAIEAALVREAVEAELPVLGVCLGHQIIATALGAELHPAAVDEVGVGAVDVTADGPLGAAGERVPVLHWHHDTVDLPQGAVLQAATDATGNQAFTLGSSVFATQFHLETTPALLAEWMRVPAMRADVADAAVSTLGADWQRVLPAVSAVADRFFGAFADAVLGGR